MSIILEHSALKAKKPIIIGIVLRKFDPSTGVSKFIVEITKRVNASMAKFIVVTNALVNAPVSNLGHLKIYTIGGSSTFLLFKVEKIRSIMESENVDVISIHGGFFASVSLPFYRHLDIPIVFVSHATKCLWRDFRFLKPKDLATQWRLLFDLGDVILSLLTPRQVLSKLMKQGNLVAMAYPTREETMNMQKYIPKKKIFTLPSGGADIHEPSSSNLSSATNTNGSLQSCPTIFFFGRCRLTRGVDTLIEAFSIVRQKSSNSRLCLFLLDDKDREKIIREMHKSKERKGIVLRVKHQKNIQNLLKLAHVIVLPFRWGRSMPSYPLTVLEAMCVGKVVVTSRVGSITKIIRDGENGILIDDPRNPMEIADKILTALNDSELRAKMGANAKKTIEQFFQWKTLAASFYKIHFNALRRWRKLQYTKN